MNAVDFVLYCAGGGIITVSSAAAFKIVVRALEAFVVRKPVAQAPPTKPERPVDPIDDGLNMRLRAFQEARFASPIVQRTLSQDAGPPVRRPFSQPTQTVRPVRPQLRPVPPPRERNVVVTLPIKQKTDAPKKDE